MSSYKHVCADRDDGLMHCKVCGGAEASLPTLCPERRMTEKEQEDVQWARLDFGRGSGIKPRWWRCLDNPLPLDMVLNCPMCSHQHIDAPHEAKDGTPLSTWTNPPHRTHLCHYCGYRWRPADVPTNGVHRVTTRGQHDDTYDPEFKRA